MGKGESSINLGLQLAREYQKNKVNRLKDQTIEQLQIGCNILLEHKICLEPSPTGGILKPDQKLIDLGVTNMSNVPQRGMFPFSRKERKKIIRMVLGRAV